MVPGVNDGMYAGIWYMIKEEEGLVRQRGTGGVESRGNAAVSERKHRNTTAPLSSQRRLNCWQARTTCIMKTWRRDVSVVSCWRGVIYGKKTVTRERERTGVNSSYYFLQCPKVV